MIHLDLWSISVVPLGWYLMEVEQQHACQMESGFLIQGKSCVLKVSSTISVLNNDINHIVTSIKKQLQKIEKKVGMEYQKAYKQG